MADPTHRAQTHRRDIDGGIGVWEVPRLWRLAANLPVRRLPLSALEPEYEQVYWFGDQTQPTVRAVADHANKIAAADLSHPIILSHTGAVMDGMHRVAKALMLGHDAIDAVQFDHDPDPDRIDPTAS